jgi:hypothetical protein
MVALFSDLRLPAARVLKEDPSNNKAKTLLHKLDASHDLLRSVLRRINSGEAVWLKPGLTRAPTTTPGMIEREVEEMRETTNLISRALQAA